MTGCRNGVVASLKEKAPSPKGVHCAALRVNLASTQTAAAVPYVKKFNDIIRQLHDFFDNSAVRSAGLQAVESILKEKGCLLAPCSARWHSIERSVSRLKSCILSVIISLQREGEERSNAKAVGIHSLVCKNLFLATMLLLSDALPQV